MHPEIVKTQVVQFAPVASITFFKKGTVFSQANVTHATVASRNKFVPYSNAAVTTGLETARCILPYDVVVGTDGTYWYGNSTVGSSPGVYGETRKDVDMYFGGCFLTSDLYVGAGHATDGTGTRLDSTNSNDMVDTLAAIADLNGTIIMLTSHATTPVVYAFRF
jgi:hypothetical protein